MKAKKANTTVKKSSGNVFADIGHSNPEEAKAKAHLAIQIYKVIKAKKLTQREAAKILGIDQPKISDITSGKLSRYSIDRLMRFLRLLGHDIEIRITKTKKRSTMPSLTVIETRPQNRQRLSA